MNHTAEIFLWGVRIGIIHQEPSNDYSTFEYDENFVKSNIQVFPIKMPLSKVVYKFPELKDAPFFGMPGLVSDSLPDSFGNKVIENWLSRQGKSLKDFNAIDRLCYTGKRGMGALEYRPVSFDSKEISDDINVEKMVEFASDILKERQSIVLNENEKLTYSQLIQVGSSAGGARAKALIAWNRKTGEIRSGQIDTDDGFDYWLIKFDNIESNGDHGIEDHPQYTLIEYVYYQMAKEAGIEMSECEIYRINNQNHFITKRFDRKGNEKLHMLSLGSLAHINYNEPGLCSYELACQYMKEIGLSNNDIEQFYRRMVFNCLAVNQDDHVKNISFLMNKKGEWSLSPAYDLTFAYEPTNRWLRQHQMSINGKLKDISHDDLVQAGINMEIKQSKCLKIILEVQKAVNNFKKYAEAQGIKKETINFILKIINENSIKLPN